jgi:enoyl-CoA hydratase
MSTGSDDVVLVDVTDRVATITMNRPEARNAINGALGVGVARTIGALEADDGVDVMILTGTDPAFCAGADLKELAAGGASARERSAGPSSPDDFYQRDLLGKFAHFRGPFPPHTKPLIGAVNGPCITGGFEFALNCDFLIASDRARFADTHARVGVMPGWGLTVLLVEAIGLRRARELSVTGNFLDPKTALEWGLVNHVVGHDELLPFCRALGQAIVSNDQAGVRRMLETYDEISGTLYDAGWEVEDRVNRDWLAAGVDHEEVARRRQGIVDRGRSQM